MDMFPKRVQLAIVFVHVFPIRAQFGHNRGARADLRGTAEYIRQRSFSPLREEDQLKCVSS
jgi:hypothetical protein